MRVMSASRRVSRVLALASLSLTAALPGCFEDDEPLVISASSGSETGSGGTGDSSSSGTGTATSTTGTTGTGTGTSGSGTATSSTTDATTGTSDATTTGSTGTTDPTTTGTTGTTGTTDPTTTGTTDPTTTGTTDPTTTGTTGDVPCGGICAPPIPPMWTGPFAIATGNDCGDAWPDPEGAARFEGFVAGGGSCSCSCSGTPTGNCSSSLGVCTYQTSSCGQGCNSGGGISANQCYDPPTDLSFRVTVSNPTGVTCGSGTVADGLTDPGFEREVQLCRPGTPPAGVCDTAGEACVPAPSGAVDTRLCIVREGDLACPVEYPNKTLVFSGASDTRACPSSCSCSVGGSPACTATYTGYTDGQNCSSASAQGSGTVTSATDVCVINASTTSGGIRVETPRISGGQCSPAQNQVAPTGSQEPTGASTVCCVSPSP
jgi:hypothetical protein